MLFHYATSLPLLGAGAVYAPGEPGEYRYSLGQKHTDIQYDVNGSTTSSKPFISTRDEPHADHKYIRLHIVGYRSARITMGNTYDDGDNHLDARWHQTRSVRGAGVR